VAAAMVTGDGRSGQATAIQFARELDGWERERVRAGLGRFDRPRPEPVGLAKPSGPAGQLGQQASWAKQALEKFAKSKFSNLNSNVISYWIQTKNPKFK
jgi:hypothetical protein